MTRPQISINTLAGVSLVVFVISISGFLVISTLRYRAWSLSEKVEVAAISSEFSGTRQTTSGAGGRVSSPSSSKVFRTEVVDSGGRAYSFESPSRFRTGSLIDIRVIEAQNRVVQMDTTFWLPVCLLGGLSFFSFGIYYSVKKICDGENLMQD
jgi:hypothetical protein